MEKNLVDPDDHLQEPVDARGCSLQVIICKRPATPGDHLQQPQQQQLQQQGGEGGGEGEGERGGKREEVLAGGTRTNQR